MMKLYRPLCSDITLRLAVDISPDEDVDEDEEMKQLGEPGCDNDVYNNDAHQSTSAGQKRSNSSSANVRFSKNNHKTVEACDNAPSSRQTPRNCRHNHSHSWYSRQNTSDKTAKDIYNHEHVLNGDGNTESFHRVPLDSEFKRSIEEEGNDFKEVSLYDELGENGNLNSSSSLNTPTGNEYDDAKLSACFRDTTKVENTRFQSSDSETAEDNSESYARGSSKRKLNGDDEQPQTDFEKDEDDDDDDDGEIVETDHDMETDVSDEYEIDGVSAHAPEELAVDFDEDVGVVDKQLLSQSMIESYYGEVDETLLQPSKDEDPGQEMETLADEMTKSIAEEIHEVLVDGATKTDDVISGAESCMNQQLPFPYPFTLKHAGHLFDKSRHHFTRGNKTSSRSRTCSTTSRSTLDETPNISTNSSPAHSPPVKDGVKRRTSREDRFSRQTSVSTVTSLTQPELEVTHRGLHRFVPRHKDEINIGIGDPVHVIKECDDLWCEGINLRTGEKGIFPAVYANDLTFLEESDDDEDYWKFSMKFLGSVEVTSHKGDDTLIQAIGQVAKTYKGNISSASCSNLEINQYGIRMIDKSKEGHEKDTFSHFFALKNISFCGTHPKNNRYFAFITKHPREYRFACHVFYGDRPTHRARDALGEAFKRFYQEYMAFTHPTEDIYIE